MPPKPQATIADTSVAALSTTSLATSLAATTPSPQVAQSEVLPPPDSTTVAPFTTIGIVSGLGAIPTQTNTDGSTTTVVAVPSSGSGSNGNGSTIAVAGGVIGGVALVSLVAFFIWFWRRRILKRRRSTLLTPLTPDPSFGIGRGEKQNFYIRQDSIGPTPRSTKVKAAFRNQYGRVRGRFDTLARSGSISSISSHSSARSVDMNRGNSQFMDTPPIMGREGKNSSALSARKDNDMTIKERIMGVWARFKGSRVQDSLDDRNDIFAARGLDGAVKEKQAPRTRPLTNKPDFLTLLNMDDGELDREAQRRRISRTRGGSEGSGLRGLSLDFGADPFSDVNALAQSDIKVAPLVVSRGNNPFSDANAINAPPKPSTYVNDIRHSRNLSMTGSSTAGLNKAYDIQDLRIAKNGPRPLSGANAAGPQGSFYVRDSAGSFDSFITKRDKFRSDPFDLEQLSSQVSDSMPSYLSRPPLAPSRPTAAHTRNVSDGSSKYSSGISDETFDEWSDPGPDVGPGAQSVYGVSRRSSTAAGQQQPYSDGSAAGSRRTSQGGSVKMGYAL